MRERTTKQKLTRLKTLVNEVGPMLYERTILVAEVHTDEDWIADVGGIRTAEAILMDDYFPDLKPFVSLLTLKRLAERFPAESEWKKRKYKLGRLLADLSAGESSGFAPAVAPPKAGPVKPRNSSAAKPTVQAEELPDELPADSSAEDEVTFLRRKLEQAESDNAVLRQVNRALKRRVKELTRQLEERIREAEAAA